MAIALGAFGEERALILGCKAGDNTALCTFYERFSPPVYRYVLASVGHRQDAEDITADVFVKAFRGLRGFRDQSKPVAAWLFRIARNEVTDYYRSRGRRPAPAPVDSQQIESQGRYDPMETTGLVMDLARALSQLPGPQRQAVLLRLVAGLSTREAAGTMKLPEGTLRSHLHHGIRALRTEMER